MAFNVLYITNFCDSLSTLENSLPFSHFVVTISIIELIVFPYLLWKLFSGIVFGNDNEYSIILYILACSKLAY